jgi:amidase
MVSCRPTSSRAGSVESMRDAEARLASRLNRVFDDHDVLLTPHPSQPPVPIPRVHHRGTARTWWEAANLVAYDAAWNLTGQPAASVPAGSTPDGLPLSVQLVGRPNDEATLISLAAQLESELRWPDHRPPVA